MKISTLQVNRSDLTEEAALDVSTGYKFLTHSSSEAVPANRTKYTYDAWNQLVKVTMKQDTDITIQTAKYDALGRRLEKVVTNAGDHDGTTRYYYQGHQIVQADDGSGNLLMQPYHGTQYIDELIGMRLEHGRVYVHQDANWRVMALTDLAGQVLERNHYSPYGQLEVAARTYFGDYNGDSKVDSTDAGYLTTNGTCWGTASGDCRVFDFDCDGDLDTDDQHTLSDLYEGLSSAMQNRRTPSTSFSQVGNPFTHQGLAFDVEIGSHQNRMRQYNPLHKRFMQRDPLVTEAPDERGHGIELATRSCSGVRCELKAYEGSTRFHAARAPSGYQDGMNLYQYVRANPLGLSDAFGLCCPTWYWGNCNAPPPPAGRCNANSVGLFWQTYGICNCGFACLGVQMCSRNCTCNGPNLRGWYCWNCNQTPAGPCQ